MFNFYSFNDVINFGKYKGLTIRTVLNTNPSYLKWALGYGIISAPDDVCDQVTDAMIRKEQIKKYPVYKSKKKLSNYKRFKSRCVRG